jgi:hypothetical protein
MSRSKLFLLPLFLLALAAAWSPAWADGPAPSNAIAVLPAPTNAGCQPATLDLTAPNTCQAPKLSVGELVPQPEFLANKHLGYCHCGCGPATCRTSADCGGASCDQFPSCC